MTFALSSSNIKKKICYQQCQKPPTGRGKYQFWTRLGSKEYSLSHYYIFRLEPVLLECVRYLSFSWMCSMQKIGRWSKSCGRGLDLSSSKDTTWKSGKLTSVTSWALESNIKFGCNLLKFFSTKKKSIAFPKSRLSILIEVPCNKVY